MTQNDVTSQSLVYTFYMLWVAFLVVFVSTAWSWPWMQSQGTLGSSVGYDYMQAGHSFPDGKRNSPDGENLPICGEVGGDLRVQSLNLGTGYVVLPHWKVSAYIPFSRVNLDCALDPNTSMGLADVNLSLQYSPSIEWAFFPSLALKAGMVLPTGNKSQNALEASLGEGFWVPWAGFSLGKKFGDIYVWFDQRLAFPSEREVTSSARLRRGWRLHSDVNVMGVYKNWHVRLRYYEMRSEQRQFISEDLPRPETFPGWELQQIGGYAGKELFDWKMELGLDWPTNGIALPTGIKYGMRLSRSWDL